MANDTVLWAIDRRGVATVTLNRPERKNPLTFESYRELTDFFRACAFDDQVKVIIITGVGPGMGQAMAKIAASGAIKIASSFVSRTGPVSVDEATSTRKSKRASEMRW